MRGRGGGGTGSKRRVGEERGGGKVEVRGKVEGKKGWTRAVYDLREGGGGTERCRFKGKARTPQKDGTKDKKNKS